MKHIFNFICISLLFVAELSFAQAPEKMSYQAVVRDGSDNLVTSTSIGMQISILQGSASGSAVYVERQFPTTNANGLASIEIGNGTVVSGNFTTIDWANGSYFVKTEIDLNGGSSYTITGTSQLLSVPYALFAKKSGDAGWGLSGNSGTNPNNNYIGTTDNQDVVFKRNSLLAGKLTTSNTSFGLGSLNANTTGSSNTSTGVDALGSNTTGSLNTANGRNALQNSTTGSSNTAIGFDALRFNTTGFSNTANGRSALRLNTTGNSNTANGEYALQNNATGNANTANGVDALAANTTGNANTANGYEALWYNTIGNFNTANGVDALRSNTTGSNNTAIGSDALYNNTTGFNNTGIGFGARVPSATGSNQVRIGNTDVNYAGVQVAWSVTSDSRWKTNVSPSILGLNFINSLNPVSYTRNNDDSQKLEFGLIAQELQKSLIYFKAENNGIITTDDEGMLSVRYNDLIAPMVKAIQEQQQMIEQLKKEIEELRDDFKKN